MPTSTILRLAQITTNVVSGGVALPPLSPALAIIQRIIRTCEIAEANREKLGPLKEQCEEIQELLRLFVHPSSSSSSNEFVNLPQTLLRALLGYQQLWKQTLKSVESWSKPPKRNPMRWPSDVDKVTKGIQKTKEDMNRCYYVLMITCGIQTRDGQAHLHTQIDERFQALNQKIDILLSNAEEQRAFREALPSLLPEVAPPLLSRMRSSLHKRRSGTRQFLKDNMLDVQQNFGQLLPGGQLTSHEVSRDTPSGIMSQPSNSQHMTPVPVKITQHSDIFKGDYLGRPCALKKYRNISRNSEDVERCFQREVALWNRVYQKDKGNYILPFLGFLIINKDPHTVSPWMDNGDVRSYLSSNKDVDRKLIVLRVAEALAFLHIQSPVIVHGHVKGSNVLINDSHQAVLADFSLSKALKEAGEAYVSQTNGLFNEYRWYAPERSHERKVSPASDVYSFSMTVLEIFTGHDPFHPERFGPTTITKIHNNHRPTKPSDPVVIHRGLDDNMWTLLQECWSGKPANRPTMVEVVDRLKCLP